MQNAENLHVTAEARILAQAVYSCTREFPSEERFGLAAQMRRAAVSVGSNIYEGCGREGNRELARYLQISYGSISELQYQAVLADDLGLLSSTHSEQLREQLLRTKKMLASLIGALRRRQQRSATRARA